MSNHSVIEHRANYHYVKLEEDYVIICSQGKQYPHCKAFILAILEQWTNDKLSKGQSPHIYMTYPQWIDALYGLFRRNHVIDCLAELIQEKLIFRQPCRLHGKDTFEYTLNVQEVQARLSQLAERTEKYSRPKINPFKFKRVEKQTGVNLGGTTDTNLNGSERDDPSKFGHNIDSSTEIPSDIDSTRESANAPARTEISSEENDLEETQKRKATLPQNHNMGTQPPLPRKPQANSTIPRRPRPQQQELTDELPAGAHSKPVEPLAEMTWGTRKCLQWFDYWRGGTLIAKYKLQQAASCAKGLAEQFDEKTVVEVYGDMAADQYYIDRGGPDVCDVANNIHKYLNRKKPKKEPSNEHKATQQPANAFIERCLDKDYNKKKLEWMREENARRRQAQAEGVQ